MIARIASENASASPAGWRLSNALRLRRIRPLSVLYQNIVRGCTHWLFRHKIGPSRAGPSSIALPNPTVCA